MKREEWRDGGVRGGCSKSKTNIESFSGVVLRKLQSNKDAVKFFLYVFFFFLCGFCRRAVGRDHAVTDYDYLNFYSSLSKNIFFSF